MQTARLHDHMCLLLHKTPNHSRVILTQAAEAREEKNTKQDGVSDSGGEGSGHSLVPAVTSARARSRSVGTKSCAARFRRT